MLTTLIDYLEYRSYEAQRIRSPHVSPERWERIYTNAKIFEEIFTKNKGKTICHSQYLP